MVGDTYEDVAQKSLKKDLGISCKLQMIGKARIHDSMENEISATFIGFCDKKMKLNPEQIQTGKFLAIDEIRTLTSTEKVRKNLRGKQRELT